MDRTTRRTAFTAVTAIAAAPDRTATPVVRNTGDDDHEEDED